MATLRVAIDARQAKIGARDFNRATASMKTSAGSATIAIERGFSKAMRRIIDAASDAEETMNKFNVVFGENAKEAASWAEKFGDKVGRATQDVQKWMASLQDTFVPLGFARQEAEKLSKSLVKLAVDVGSFQNMTTADVIRDFTSALVGNHETVRKLGIVISETALAQEALNQGLDKSYKDLTDLEKVQLRYSLLLKGSADAIGDAERSADSYAQQVERLSANWKEFKTLLGGPAMKVLSETIGITNDLVEATKDLADEMEDIQKGPSQLPPGSPERMRAMYSSLGFSEYGGRKPFEPGPETMGILPKSEKDALEKRLKEIYGANEKIAEDDARTKEQMLEDDMNFARKRKDVTAQLYRDMGKFGSGYYNAHKALIDQQYTDYYDYIKNKALLNEWYYNQLNQIEQESYQKQKNALDLYVEDLEVRAGDIAGHFARAAGSIEFEMANAFDSIISDGESFKDAMNDFARDVGRAFSRMAAEMAAEYAMLAIFKGFTGLGNLFGGGSNLPALSTPGGPSGMGYALGGVISNGRIVPMASGAVLERPTYFPMANGNVGLAGEAGPEAILPLRRGKHGRLGVEVANPQVNVQPPNVLVKNIIVSDHRQATLEAMKSEAGQDAIINALYNNGLI